jgi:flavin-dependent dehydrogenase
MHDVVIAGAGPAGSLAALILARRGARVAIVDRSRFPRAKLCGDTLNPGAVATLSRHVDLAALGTRKRSIPGMLLTGPRGVAVRGRYDEAHPGLGVTREIFDHWLLEQAIAAGARLVHGTVVGPRRQGEREPVSGVIVRQLSGELIEYRARVTIGADGRRSRLALQCGLSRYAARPRRWAIGAYYENVDGLHDEGEMHVRDGHYIGVAATPDGRVNTCLVQPHDGEAWPSPAAMLQARLDADLLLAPRFRSARRLSAPHVLGPMAIVTPVPGCPGLLLAGDAGGFIDPMTGDGIRLALSGAELAAGVAGEILDGVTLIDNGHERLSALTRRHLGTKRRFNRALRRVVASPRTVGAATRIATFCPSAFSMIIRYASDCGHGNRGDWHLLMW